MRHMDSLIRFFNVLRVSHQADSLFALLYYLLTKGKGPRLGRLFTREQVRRESSRNCLGGYPVERSMSSRSRAEGHRRRADVERRRDRHCTPAARVGSTRAGSLWHGRPSFPAASGQGGAGCLAKS